MEVPPPISEGEPFDEEVGEELADDEQVIQSVPVSELELDPLNPRLPEVMLGRPESELLAWLNEEEVLTEIASSMLANGFFHHEPLVVLPPDAQGKRIVLEGNRRFGALSILHQLPAAITAGINFDFATAPTEFQLNRLIVVPVMEVKDRDEVRKFLGYRHIGGLKTWSPESKARYLEEEIDAARAAGSNEPFREVARRVGSQQASVRGQYIALKVLRAARQPPYELDSSYIIRERFGVWNRLMNSPDVRRHIGFGDARTVEEIDAAVEAMDPIGLAQVVGDLTPTREGAKPVLSDSRDATVYGAVLANPRSLETLIQYRDLALAQQIVKRGEIAERLRTLTKSIDLYVQDLDSYEMTDEVEIVARGLAGSARTLYAAVRDRIDGAN